MINNKFMTNEELIKKLAEELKWYRKSYHQLVGKTNRLILHYSVKRAENAITNDDIGNEILKDLVERSYDPFPNDGVLLDLDNILEG